MCITKTICIGVRVRVYSQLFWIEEARAVHEVVNGNAEGGKPTTTPDGSSRSGPETQQTASGKSGVNGVLKQVMALLLKLMTTQVLYAEFLAIPSSDSSEDFA